jgi:hypothetical protein
MPAGCGPGAGDGHLGNHTTDKQARERSTGVEKNRGELSRQPIGDGSRGERDNRIEKGRRDRRRRTAATENGAGDRASGGGIQRIGRDFLTIDVGTIVTNNLKRYSLSSRASE